MPQTLRRIGILAGGGSIPGEIAASIAAQGYAVSIVALDGEADGDFGAYRVHRVNWGQIGRMVSAFRADGVGDIVIVGSVSRPDLRKVRPDFGFFAALPMIWRIVRAGGDDAVLREVIGFFERRGLRVLGPADVAPGIIVGQGPLGALAPDPDRDRRDIALGLEVVARLGPLDIGQGVVVADGRVEAIEGVEGTDRMLARVAKLRRAAGRSTEKMRRGVLIKRPKPGQELRIDLPAIGPATVKGADDAGLGGIAVLAGRTIAAERAALIRLADEVGIFVEGIGDDLAADVSARVRAAVRPVVVAPLGGPRLSSDDVASATKGARVVAAVEHYGVGRVVAVVRRHVLAVEAGEGELPFLARIGALRQWGEGRRRRGVAVLQGCANLSVPVVEAIARCGLAGVVLAGSHPHAIDPPLDIMGAAARLGLFVARASGGDGEADGE